MTDLLDEIKHLLELKGENPFRVRAFEKAILTLESVGEAEDWKKRAEENRFTELPGIGKGISEILIEFILEGHSSFLEELKASLPQGLEEISQIPGLGPKKSLMLIEELGIHSLGELEYACKENRLTSLKGFGEKLQKKILEGIEFISQNQGQRRLADVFLLTEKLIHFLSLRFPSRVIVEAGELRRRRETISRLEFLVEVFEEEMPVQTQELEAHLLSEVAHFFIKEGSTGLPIQFYFSNRSSFGERWAQMTATEEHWFALMAKGQKERTSPNKERLESGPPSKAGSSFKTALASEERFYQSLGLEWIPPEMRETGEEVQLARQGALSDLLSWEGVTGIFHNHTTWSDGSASVEAMVREALRLGYQYIGISDHSQSAFYAQGLKKDQLQEQQKEIQQVQEKFPQIKIFWGIESDILADGSLDYDDSILSDFDFVIASIHSRFQMDRAQMTERLIRAIQHPKTTGIGHLTGRLLLGRKGYEVDVERVIQEAAQHQVAIEINSHPHRLDIDWRYGEILRKYRCPIFINPDAHSLEDIQNVKYGVLTARKALLPSSLVVNSRSLQEVEAWLQ